MPHTDDYDPWAGTIFSRENIALRKDWNNAGDYPDKMFMDAPQDRKKLPEDFSWYKGNPDWAGEAVNELDNWRKNTFTLQQPQARWFDLTNQEGIEEYESFQRRRERGEQETIWGWLNRELINPWIDRKEYWEY